MRRGPLHINIYFPPLPEEERNSAARRLAAAETHEQIAALHGFGLK